MCQMRDQFNSVLFKFVWFICVYFYFFKEFCQPSKLLTILWWHFLTTFDPLLSYTGIHFSNLIHSKWLHLVSPNAYRFRTMNAFAICTLEQIISAFYNTLMNWLVKHKLSSCSVSYIFLTLISW